LSQTAIMRNNQEPGLKEAQEANAGPQCTRSGTREFKKPRADAKSPRSQGRGPVYSAGC